MNIKLLFSRYYTVLILLAFLLLQIPYFSVIVALAREEFGPIPANFGEEPLEVYAGPDGEAYRFTSEPTWDYVWMVRIVRKGKGKDESYTVVIKQLTGEGGAKDLGKVAQTVTRKLTVTQWAEMQRHVAAAGFWSRARWLKDAPRVLDGDSDWLEGYKEGKNHIVKRDTMGAIPEEKALAAMAGYLIKLRPSAVSPRASGNSHTKHSNGTR